ncbi:MAG: energy transducer TonB [Candidatus Acidiferrales bacterium]|jgi:TonB family protein
MAPVKSRAVFTESLLPAGQRRWGSFGAGLGLECIALIGLLIIPLFMPERFEAVQHFWVTPIEAPVVQPWKPQPPQKPVIVEREVVKEIPKPVEVVPPKPKIYNPVITTPVAKVVTQRKVLQPEVEVAKAFPDPTPMLSMGSSAVPTLRRPREAVQTGGFGDPNGVPTNGKTDRNVNINQLGAYDMPAGPGSGNGTGGAKGARGVIASTGFGNGVAVGGPGGGGHGSVQQGLFADEHAAAAGPKVKQTAAVSNTKPVEILFKPKPVYTDQARNMKIEGDVLLQVVFTSSGEVKVERVVQGLGYGLDESAQSAARQIRFHPAQQEGQPVDFPAIVHITFELAY